MTPKQVVDAIIHDIEGRKGLGDEWDQIDSDIQAEIRATWLALVLTVDGQSLKGTP